MMLVPLVAPWSTGDMSPAAILSDAGGLVSSDLKGKVALVTGASRGLGEGAARALAAGGAAVVLGARDGALAGSVAHDIAAKGALGEALSCDVSDYAAIQKAVAEAKARLG